MLKAGGIERAWSKEKKIHSQQLPQLVWHKIDKNTKTSNMHCALVCWLNSLDEKK